MQVRRKYQLRCQSGWCAPSGWATARPVGAGGANGQQDASGTQGAGRTKDTRGAGGKAGNDSGGDDDDIAAVRSPHNTWKTDAKNPKRGGG